MKKWLAGLLFSLCFAAVPATVFAETENELSICFPIAYVTNVNLNLRLRPTTESTRLETFPRGTVVWVTDYLDYEWYAVEAGETCGFMKAEFLTEYNEYFNKEEKPESPPAAVAAAMAVETEIGTVELLEWSEIKPLIKLGATMKIIDVRTKAAYYVASFSNGKHADVEPLTADDTDKMKNTYNGKWSWDTRPVIVMTGERFFAASISGMPHGGGTRDNGMNGQICLHFKGSQTHNGNKNHEKDHQDAVTEAFNTASKW